MPPCLRPFASCLEGSDGGALAEVEPTRSVQRRDGFPTGRHWCGHCARRLGEVGPVTHGRREPVHGRSFVEDRIQTFPRVRAPVRRERTAFVTGEALIGLL